MGEKRKLFLFNTYRSEECLTFHGKGVRDILPPQASL